jgi:Flp pilus assembly protein TadD
MVIMSKTNKIIIAGIIIALFAWLTLMNNTGVDRKTHTKSPANKIQLEQQLAEIKQATISSLSDNATIRKLVERGDYQQAEQLALKDESYKGTSLLLLRLSYLQDKHQGVIHHGEALSSSSYQGDAEFYFMLGTAYGWLEQYDKAITNLQTATVLNPNDASAYYNLGIAYRQKEAYDKAIEALNQAIKLKPDYAKTYNGLGIAYSRKGEYDKAIDVYNQAIKLNPDHASSYNNLGIAYDKKGEYDKAIAAYKQAIKLDPNDVLVHLNLGNAYASKEEYDKAIAAYKQAIKLDPDDEWIHLNLDYLMQLKESVTKP